MSPGELVVAGFWLLAAVAAGTVVHELSHALALRTFAIPYDVVWFPSRFGGERDGGALASVTPRPTSHDLAPWRLRTAAVMPLVMATPVFLALLGVLPDPVASGNTNGTAIVVGWLACALPSPRDFSLFWYAERALRG